MSNYQSGFTGAQIDAAVGGAVRFDVEQSKTEAQKEQAQSNIGIRNVVADNYFFARYRKLTFDFIIDLHERCFEHITSVL